MTPLQKTELEKTATEAGFDRTAVELGSWLVVRSSHFAEPVELSKSPQGHIVARVQPAIRSRDLMEVPGVQGAALDGDVPNLEAGVEVVEVEGVRALSGLLEFIAREAMERRNNPLAIFKARTRGLPATTEVERLTIQRVGQDVFRASLIEYWDGKCAVTGCAMQELLRASHIKPWSKCSSDEERLDPCNGLLLSPAWDAAFDAGYVTFSSDGVAIVSPLVSIEDRVSLALGDGVRIRRRFAEHEKYLAYHRSHVFREGQD